MKNQTLGIMISELRKEKGMTQLELANKMGVTDKAVSKWERDLSLPDINSIPKLAEILDVSVEELMQVKTKLNEKTDKKEEVLDIILKGVPLAMGVAVVVLSILGEIDMKSAFIMLGIGMSSLAMALLKNNK